MALKSPLRSIQAYRTRSDGVLGLVAQTYIQKVLSYEPVAYWPLNETSGTVARCLVNAAQNGTYTGVTLANSTAPGGSPCPLFDGVNDYCNIYSATLNSALDGDEYSLCAWVKPFNAGVFTDSQIRYCVRLYGGSSDFIEIANLTNGNMNPRERAGGVDKVRNQAHSSANWYFWAITKSLSADQIKFWLYDASASGGQIGPTLSGVGAWGGTLSSSNTTIGSTNITPAQVWYGWIANVFIFDYPATVLQLEDLATV